MSQPIIDWGGHLVFPIGPKNTNLVEDVEILHPVNLRWISFSGFREEVENGKVYWRRRTTDGRTDDGLCVPIHIHALVQPPPHFLHLNRYINKRPKGPHIVHLSTMCHLCDRSARAVIFIYSSDWKTQLGKICWDLASCQISLNPVQQFQRRSQKCISQSWVMVAIFFYRSARKTQTW